MRRHRPLGRAVANRDRQVGVRAPRERILIVCEGTKTEPNYFRDIIDTHRLNTITLQIEVTGTGRNTLSLVDHALLLQEQSAMPYAEIWCVLDKDDFAPDQFDNAIARAKDHAFLRMAWSNEAFELWYLLHFQYLDTSPTRGQGNAREYYIERLRELMGAQCHSSYAKNHPKMYTLLGEQRRDQAIRFARRLQENYAAGTPYHQCLPATMVYELVEKLLSYAPEFDP